MSLWAESDGGGMLSVIGLALDFVGAASLTLGLFRPASALYPGTLRSPEDAAADAAFGVVGLVFLGLGFFLQASPTLLGVDQSGTPPEAARAAGAAAMLGGWLAAFALYKTIYRARLRRERERMRALTDQE